MSNDEFAICVSIVMFAACSFLMLVLEVHWLRKDVEFLQTQVNILGARLGTLQERLDKERYEEITRKYNMEGNNHGNK